METWDSNERFCRLLVFSLVVFGLGWLLPAPPGGPANTALKWLIKNWREVVVAIGIGVTYLFYTKRPLVTWPQVASVVLRGLFVAELTAALIFRFWGPNWPWIAAFWFLVLVGTLKKLSDASAASTPEDDTAPSDDLDAVVIPDAQLLTDAPAEKDALNRKRLAEVITETIMTYKAHDALVIALTGGWGAGKTTTMRLLRDSLERSGYPTRWINAWLYDSKTAIWEALFDDLRSFFGEYHIPYLPGSTLAKYHRLAGEIIRASTIPSATLFSSLLTGMPASTKLEDAKNRVSDLVHKVIGERHLVIFIDDLDRCSPESVVGTLEFLKEVADFERFVFVLGVDAEAIAGVLNSRYQTKAPDFLHKVIHLSLPLNEPGKGRVINQWAPQLQKIASFAEEEAREEMAFIVESLGTNPRSIKQLLNAVLVGKAMMQAFVPYLGTDYLKNPKHVRNIIGAELVRHLYPNVHQGLSSPEVFDKFADGKENFSLKTEDLSEVTKILGRFVQLSDNPGEKTLFFSYLEPDDWMPYARAARDLEDVLKQPPDVVEQKVRAIADESPGKLRLFAKFISAQKKAVLEGGSPQVAADNVDLRAIVLGALKVMFDLNNHSSADQGELTTWWAPS